MNNECSRCGNDMGPGMCGIDKETGQPICLECWADDHPQGLKPHRNLGVWMPPGSSVPQPVIHNPHI